MSNTKFGTFEDLLEITPQHLCAIPIRLKELILSLDPDACEVVRLGDRAATYGVGPKKMSEGYCYIMPHANWINLGFYKGADIADPEYLLEGSGAKLRHVKIHSLEECDNQALAALIMAAHIERKTALGLN